MVQTPVINTWSESTILLLDEEESGPRGRVGMTYKAPLKVLTNIFVHGFRLGQRERVRFGLWQGVSGYQVNRTIVGTMRR
ncbi:hypothetical protein FKM82_025236 [Ascaphus truei]